MINMTERARDKIKFFMKDKSLYEWGVRVRSQGGQFGFALEPFNKSSPGDQVIDTDGIKIIADGRTAMLLEGATVDFLDTGAAAGFTVEIKQGPSSMPGTGGPDLSNPQAKKVYEILNNEINPALASHGGRAQLLDVKENVVYLKFGGGCQGCGMVDTTVKQGIEARIKQVMPEIIAVRDETDHAGGKNPYYRATH
ncbi:MAG: NifU family protein [Deltaproteobacteria bacterium]|nr:NifU family protein [Deltaproteobacteria bacterium]MBI2501380.1 NifU family protein [Deltaproteobacteria bacterium]MBI4196946.1 NifU family protein [Deltaproteobacteria bacterium]